MSNEFTTRQLSGLHETTADEWNSLTDDSNPFVGYEYLHGLEAHDCLDSHGWTPCHLAVYSGAKLAGAVPLYSRTNSYGEFVFDWSWADAYERIGGRYYPKLVSAIPFAPVIGPRLLVHPDHPQINSIRQQLLKKILLMIKTGQLSSFHSLFADDPESVYLENKLLKRFTVQYRWQNRNYRDFQDFLDGMTSKKRKQIRRERKKVIANKIEIEIFRGSEINQKLWDIYYHFYCSTFLRRWGNPRLTLGFFNSLSQSLPESTLLILAKSRNQYIAGSFLMTGGGTLYGRHWGCIEQSPYLHFELCYYQAIEYCISNGIEYLDAGVQGEHKLARGFAPFAASSYHWIEDLHFRNAVREFLDRERSEIQTYVGELTRHLPYKETSG